MKYLSKFTILFLASAFAVQTICAQNSIDANRMNRDVSIMENILQELFKTRWEAHGSIVRVRASGLFAASRSSDIRGTYLPGYGIIFIIPGGPPGFITYSDSEEDKSYSYTFRYSDDASSKKAVSEESITRRIREFLREYGSTIGQLSENDRIMVIYNTQQQIREFPFFDSSDDQKKRQLLPTISVVAQMKDLQAYRSGNLSVDELDQRLSVSKSDAETKERLDLKVMANIFETALKEQESSSFRIRSSVNYLNLDNFGALFFFDARYGQSFSLTGSFNFEPLDMFKANKITLDSNRVNSLTVLDGTVNAKVKDLNNKESQKRKEEMAERNAKELKAYKKFLSNIKEYLIDYGRTLRTVQSNQHIMVSATVSSSVDEIPERIDIQITKSVLEAMDKGNTSRDEAINQIVVREY